MKNLKTLLIIAGLAISIASCSQRQFPPASELLQDKPMQDSIMAKISSDPQLMTNMMDHMRNNGNAMQMMQNGQMIQNGQMMQNGRMQSMMNMTGGDSTTVRNMFNMMVQNPAMMSMMMNMMAQNPQSMKMMQNMMQHKGMMGGMGMMNK